MVRTVCPGCGDDYPDHDGPTHRYMTSSAGCWLAFGELLAAQYSSPARRTVHQVVVDAYAAQHPGDGKTRQQLQSVGLHLMTLCLFLEHGTDPLLGTSLHRKMVSRPAFRRLERTGPGAITLRQVPVDGPVEEVRRSAFAWAQAVWDTYRDEHPTVRSWLRDAGFDAPAHAHRGDT